MRPLKRARRGSDLLGAAAHALGRPPPALGYALFTLAVFLVALALTLPHDLIAARALEAATAGAPVTASFGEVHYSFPNGYRFAAVRLVPVRAPATALALSELTVRTPLLGLLLGRPRSASFSGRAFGGTLSGDFEVRGPRATVDLDLQAIDLARAVGPLLPSPARVLGAASLELELSGDGRTMQSAEGNVRLTVRGLALDHVALRGVVLPDLTLPEVTLTAQVSGSRLQIRELHAGGDDLTVEGTGDVLLRDPLPQSVLNLRLTIDVRPTAPSAVRLAAALLPRRPAGEKPVYTLAGTIAAPTVK